MRYDKILLTNKYLWFSSLEISLNKNLSNSYIFADVTNGLLHRFTRPQNRHTAYLIGRHPLPVVRNALGRIDKFFVERHQRERVLDDQSYQTVAVKYELVPWGVFVSDKRVQSPDLRRGR